MLEEDVLVIVGGEAVVVVPVDGVDDGGEAHEGGKEEQHKSSHSLWLLRSVLISHFLLKGFL